MKVSLVLGSGGARGLAHIGVIRCLEERGYEIASIAGSSMGAVVGGIHAAGKLDTYTEWVCALQRLDIVRLLDPSFTGAALFKGEAIIQVLRELIGERDIETLPVGFTAVAADLHRGREIWLNSGPLFDAIRASIAVPMVFAPVPRGNLLLVDGGIVNPVPIAPTLNNDTDLTIAVNLNGPWEPGLTPKRPPARPRGAVAARLGGEAYQQYRERIARFVDGLRGRGEAEPPAGLGMTESVTRSMDIMASMITRLKLAAYDPNILIEIPRNLCTFFEFHRARELLDFGYERAEETLERVRESFDS